MEGYRRSSGLLLLLLGLFLLSTTMPGVQGDVEPSGPSESECRPYIQKALKQLEVVGVIVGSSETENDCSSTEDIPTVEIISDDFIYHDGNGEKDDTNEYEKNKHEQIIHEKTEPEVRLTVIQKISSFFQKTFQRTPRAKEEVVIENNQAKDKQDDGSQEQSDQTSKDETGNGENEAQNDSREDKLNEDSKENDTKTDTDTDDDDDDNDNVEEQIEDTDSRENEIKIVEDTADENDGSKEQDDSGERDVDDSEDGDSKEHVVIEPVDTREENSKEQVQDLDKPEPVVDNSEEQKQSDEDEDKEIDHENSLEIEENSIQLDAENQAAETDDLKESVEEQTHIEEDQAQIKVQIEENDDNQAKTDNKEESEEESDRDSQEQSTHTDLKDNESITQETITENINIINESIEEKLQDRFKRDVDNVEDNRSTSNDEESHSIEDDNETKEQLVASKNDVTSTEDEVVSEQDEGDSREDPHNVIESEEDNDTVKSEEKEKTSENERDSNERSVEKEDEGDNDDSKETDEKSTTKNDEDEDSLPDKKDSASVSAEDNIDSQQQPIHEGSETKSEDEDDTSDEESGSHVEDLSFDTEIPTKLRPRDHVEQLLKLDEKSSETEKIINAVSDITIKDLRKLYENAIKPLEILYKYRDLSNRHFGDSEIYSKPLILFMGPWSAGKSSIINYLTNNEYNDTALRTGAEPSPAYFNILMYGEEPEVIEGTELAADFTFSGLQKFGQGLEERLRGVKIPSKLLEKVNIVEIPGILEIRKQVSRVFPFNDACQWFIDRGDIIFLVYDPTKLDVGPETEAILDQLKGREHQSRILLNKADQVKPDELMRVQGALIWNISPLMSSPQPPVMYTTSLWSRPYESWAPVKLLQSQEKAFLRDLRGAIDKKIENKIASARRFAVRVRNHAKMVDCYLTTYYNHKSVFGNRKQVADAIIDHPQDYHIYEGLSTLTNISRYDLPDPDVYRGFFKLNPLYEFQKLSETCTYFRGCPINRLDIAIAYDLPELLGTHRKRVDSALSNEASNSRQQTSTTGS